jgi:hypothetical protein
MLWLGLLARYGDALIRQRQRLEQQAVLTLTRFATAASETLTDELSAEILARREYRAAVQRISMAAETSRTNLTALSTSAAAAEEVAAGKGGGDGVGGWCGGDGEGGGGGGNSSLTMLAGPSEPSASFTAFLSANGVADGAGDAASLAPLSCSDLVTPFEPSKSPPAAAANKGALRSDGIGDHGGSGDAFELGASLLRLPTLFSLHHQWHKNPHKHHHAPSIKV